MWMVWQRLGDKNIGLQVWRICIANNDVAEPRLGNDVRNLGTEPFVLPEEPVPGPQVPKLVGDDRLKVSPTKAFFARFSAKPRMNKSSF
jgi:hypothetical protein